MMQMRSKLEISENHPSFAGHFPNFPVLPGAVLLDETLEIIEKSRGIDLTQWHIASAKFLDAVRPRDKLVVEHDATEAGIIRFEIRADSRKVASGTLSQRGGTGNRGV
jgi:3-hydroxymyristoyl/3-hydroxydecanoyl-(acyl carrier protein) dehydratase